MQGTLHCFAFSNAYTNNSLIPTKTKCLSVQAALTDTSHVSSYAMGKQQLQENARLEQGGIGCSDERTRHVMKSLFFQAHRASFLLAGKKKSRRQFLSTQRSRSVNKDSLWPRTKSAVRRYVLSHRLLIGTFCKTKLKKTNFFFEQHSCPLWKLFSIPWQLHKLWSTISFHEAKVLSTCYKSMQFLAKQVTCSDLLSALAQTNRTIH